MAAARPFGMVEDVFQKSETIWRNMRVADWLEAFAAHPKIGSRKAVPQQESASAGWSKVEQVGVDKAAVDIREALEDANRLYEEKFGFIFIVCATGKSAAEMLDLCRRRIGNDRAVEISIAADEQRKITEIRLGKLLEQ